MNNIMCQKGSEMNIIAVIPARMGSSRFPGKPMAPILGMPMIEHVYRRVCLAQSLSQTYVATCDQVIFDAIEQAGGRAILTRDDHERCTDRCAEALEKIEASDPNPVDILVMVQGDEPMVYPQMIDEAVAPLIKDSRVKVSNLLGKISSEKEFVDPNTIKVVVDKRSNALYFSRAPIPSSAKFQGDVPRLKQVCIIPFQRDFLLKYQEMEPTELEVIESVDMLRILEWGEKVRMVPTQFETKAVDTREDLAQVEAVLSHDKLVKQYLQK